MKKFFQGNKEKPKDQWVWPDYSQCYRVLKACWFCLQPWRIYDILDMNYRLYKRRLECLAQHHTPGNANTPMDICIQEELKQHPIKQYPLKQYPLKQRPLK